MLNIYYGRQSVDKEKFIFHRIREEGFSSGDPVVILVPDQYTIQAERSAFQHLETKSLIGLDVYSVSRLGHRVLAETGGDRNTFIDKYGRQMLLTQIAREVDRELFAFRGMMRSSFVEMANDLISQMKQYGIFPEDLKQAAGELPEEEILRNKLLDIALIYERYQDSIAGKYTDSEDQVDLMAEKISSSSVRNARVWIWGFDSIAPKTMLILQKLMEVCPEVNLVMTYDMEGEDRELFTLADMVIQNMKAKALEAGCPMGAFEKVDPELYGIRDRAPGISTLEQELYKLRPGSFTDHSGITLVEAANMHNEAESAASFVLELIRDKGLRLRDIMIICNDQERRARALQMAFREYGIPLFLDRKREAGTSDPAMYVTSLMKTVFSGYRTDDLLRGLKSAMCGLDPERVEKLDIYARKYGIDRYMWNRPFRYGIEEYGEEGFQELESTREEIEELLRPLEELAKNSTKVRDFAAGLYTYMKETLELPERLTAFRDQQLEMGENPLAEETGQIFGYMVDILDQVVELMGEDPFKKDEFLEIFSMGLSQMEIGVLPASMDDLMMGTLQRSRSGDIRALLVVGANEGLIPAEVKDGGLLGLDELEYLAEGGRELGKLDSIRVREEKMAIYRNLSQPRDHLWISYATGDQEGQQIRRSPLVEDILRIFPDLQVEKDVLNRQQPEMLLSTGTGTLRHLASARRQQIQGEPLDPIWQAVEDKLRNKTPEKAEKLERYLGFSNSPEPLDPLNRELLFRGIEDYRLSPSRLETYGHCPFEYFVQYGLSPREVREFQVDNRDLGNLYHECIRRMAQKLDSADLWDSMTQEECLELARETQAGITGELREGILHSGPEAEYINKRLVPVCSRSMWALISQARHGKISRKRHEVGFGQGRPIDPIEVEAGGKTIYIEGQIDRLDQLENGRIKIIDYKSGNKDLTQEQARSGYSLQLMLYMKAALGDELKPAGVFYFHIQDPKLKYDQISGADDRDAKVLAERMKSYKLTGMAVNDPETLDQLIGTDPGAESVAVGIKKGKDGTYKEGRRVLSEEEFAELQKDVDERVREFCSDLVEGRVDIHPMNEKGTPVCDYCSYKGICRFDQGYPGCRYNYI